MRRDGAPDLPERTGRIRVRGRIRVAMALHCLRLRGSCGFATAAAVHMPAVRFTSVFFGENRAGEEGSAFSYHCNVSPRVGMRGKRALRKPSLNASEEPMHRSF